MRDIVAIVNTQAGIGMNRRQLTYLARQLRHILSVPESRIWLAEESGKNSARSLANLAQTMGAKAIVVFGGDGTVHQVVNGLNLPDYSMSIGIVPCGTANVVASYLGMPRSVKSALEIIRAGITKTIDLGVLEGDNLPKHVVFAVSVGLDAMINELAHQIKPNLRKYRLPSILSYVPPLLQYALGEIPLYEVTIKKDEQIFNEGISFLAVTNTPRYGGGFLLDGLARLDDGLLNWVCARNIRSRDLAWWMFQMWRGNHIYYPKVFLPCSSFATLEIISDSFLPTQVDGETQIAQKDIAVSVFPRALQVFAPLSQLMPQPERVKISGWGCYFRAGYFQRLTAIVLYGYPIKKEVQR